VHVYSGHPLTAVRFPRSVSVPDELFHRPRVELWTGPPGRSARVVGSALIARMAPVKNSSGIAVGRPAPAVEVYGAVFEVGVGRKDYEASDLLYQSDAYSGYVTEHFGNMGLPTTRMQLGDLQQLHDSPVRFLWSAVCTRLKKWLIVSYSTIDIQKARQDGFVLMCANVRPRTDKEPKERTRETAAYTKPSQAHALSKEKSMQTQSISDPCARWMVTAHASMMGSCNRRPSTRPAWSNTSQCTGTGSTRWFLNKHSTPSADNRTTTPIVPVGTEGERRRVAMIGAPTLMQTWLGAARLNRAATSAFLSGDTINSSMALETETDPTSWSHVFLIASISCWLWKPCRIRSSIAPKAASPE